MGKHGRNPHTLVDSQKTKKKRKHREEETSRCPNISLSCSSSFSLIMDVQNILSKVHKDLLFIGFNQDSTCISVGTRTGYQIYNCSPFAKCFVEEDIGGIGVVGMLYSSSLIALIGGGEHVSYPKYFIWKCTYSLNA